MNKIYLITTAIQCRYTTAHLISQPVCVLAATELEAAATAFNNQSEQTYIFWIEVCQPQIYLFTLNQAMFVQQLFNVWQDLAAEASGHDTEWGYLVSIDRLAQALHMVPKIFVVLLANLTQPGLEVGLSGMLTFHQPPIQAHIPAVIQEFYRTQSDVARLKLAENCLSQKHSFTLLS